MEVAYLLTAEIPSEFHCAQTQLSICNTLCFILPAAYFSTFGFANAKFQRTKNQKS